jgi:uncharacterized protein Usg
LQQRYRRAKLEAFRTESDAMVAVDFKRQLQGYGLTTANILYRMPDHPRFLQTYVWQNYDLAPLFPELRRFLDFWSRELEGPLHSVKVAHRRLVSAADVRTISTEFQLN